VLGPESFGVLSAAFSEDSVVLSEAGKDVRCFNLASGTEVWTHHPELNHFLELSYCSAAGKFYGIRWPTVHNGNLERFSSAGEVEESTTFGRAWEAIFCCSGNRLITNEGAVFDVASGRLIHRLPFPALPT